MKRLPLVLPLLFGSMLAAARPGCAAGAAPDSTLSPYFFVENGDPALDRLPLKATKVDVHIAGVIAEVVVSQVYRNEGERPLNARYVFPGSTRAAVHGMTMQIGDRIVRAKIREKEQARQEYAAAQAAGKSAALLEQERPNVFSMRVANVLPQDEIRVELRYSELLVPTAGIYELVYPTVVGPRYSRGPKSSGTAPAAEAVKVPTLHAGEPAPSTFSIETNLAAGMPVSDLSSPSHKTTIEWQGLSDATVGLDPSETNGGDRDFILRYRLQGERVQTGLLLYPGEKENFFLLMMQPPRRVTLAQIPKREYIFVLDVSGSMYGFPLNTAKALMRELIGGLRPVDRFNVILFSGGSRILASQSLLATRQNLEFALAEIDREQGGGGTELGAALDQALNLPGKEGYSRSTLVVTDGYIDAEAAVFEGIRKNLSRSNLFAFGIGGSVNRHLIEGMAHAGQGEPFIVTSPDEAPEAARRLREYIQSPVLTDIKVQTPGFETYDVEPLAVPDLFADRPLIVFGKWKGTPTGTIRVTGTAGDGPFESVIDVPTADSSPANRPLRALWARERVRRLSDYAAETDEPTRQEIVRLGLTYQLLTRYTSFIAVSEEVRNKELPAKSVDQPVPMPAGVSDGAVGDEVPEPGLLAMLALALALYAAAWILRYRLRLRNARMVRA